MSYQPRLDLDVSSHAYSGNKALINICNHFATVNNNCLRSELLEQSHLLINSLKHYAQPHTL